MKLLDCHNAIKQVKSNYQTALQTVNVLIGIVVELPQLLYNHNLDLTEMRSLALNLHDVYFVRMFASFESSLRHYWRTKLRDTKPLTQQILSSLAGRFGVPQDTLDIVQEIREFRNYLIHEEHEIKKRFTIEEASKHLNTFLARLPIEW